MEIETVLLIENFEQFVQKLPPEHRSESYEFAESFLCVGAIHGALTGLTSSVGTTSKADKLDEYIAYLQKKSKRT